MSVIVFNSGMLEPVQKLLAKSDTGSLNLSMTPYLSFAFFVLSRGFFVFKCEISLGGGGSGTERL